MFRGYEHLPDVVERCRSRQPGHMAFCKTDVPCDNPAKSADSALVQFISKPHCIVISRISEAAAAT
jgi:hypothetical protein